MKIDKLVSCKPLTSFQPSVTCSPPDSPDPEKSRVKTVIFDGNNIIAASLASVRQPLTRDQDKELNDWEHLNMSPRHSECQIKN